MFPMEIGSDYTQEQKNQMTLFLVSINSNLIMNIRIYHKCEGRIERSVPRITFWHHEAC